MCVDDVASNMCGRPYLGGVDCPLPYPARDGDKVVGELACSRGPGDYDTQCSDEHLDFHCKIDDDEDGRSDAQDLVGRCRLTL